jgi:hypothetical protein
LAAMDPARRLSIAAFLTVAVGLGAVAFLACSGAQLPDRGERARLAVEGARLACQELFRVPPEVVTPEVLVACETLLGEPTVKPVASGEPTDGGPGQGARSVP